MNRTDAFVERAGGTLAAKPAAAHDHEPTRRSACRCRMNRPRCT